MDGGYGCAGLRPDRRVGGRGLSGRRREARSGRCGGEPGDGRGESGVLRPDYARPAGATEPVAAPRTRRPDSDAGRQHGRGPRRPRKTWTSPAVALGPVRRGVEKGTAPGAVEKRTARASEPTRDAVDDPEWLRTRLEKVRRRYDLPDLGAAIVIEDKVVAASVVGVRKYGTQIAAERDDPFHVGSITKVMTATLIGMLVDDGILRWDMTMEEMFPELIATMQPGYRKVTVLQLLSHTGGFPYEPSIPIGAITAQGRNAVERRYAYVKAAIIDPPQRRRGPGRSTPVGRSW